MKFEFSNIVLIVQVAAAVLAVMRYKKYKSKFMIYLIILLITTAVTEVIGAYYINFLKKSSYIFHYVYTLIAFNLILMMYNQLIVGKNKKKLMMGLNILFCILWVYVLFDKKLFYYSVVLGAVNTSFYLFLYMRQLLLSEEVINYRKMLSFWVTISFFIFYLPSIPFFIIKGFMKDTSLFYVLLSLILTMNLILIYGLVWSKKEIKY